MDTHASLPTPVPPHLQGLNAPQAEAASHTNGPLLVLAGAGTGKTRVLISRLTHLLYEGLAWPSQILAVTFTNKAANEMRTRVEAYLGQNMQGLWLGTFHSVCAKILRKYADFVGLGSDFTIIDTDDQLRVLKQILKARGLDDRKEHLKAILGQIESWKDRGLTVPHVEERFAQNEDMRFYVNLYALYQAQLRTLNACDFGDLLLHTLTLFRDHPHVLQHYQDQFRYIMVDEYQDTNVAQYLWLRLLAQGHHNICCVGDDDQSIYGWRGAEVGNILRFEQDYSEAVVVRLEQNYRSTHHILQAASGLIHQNKERLGKKLWTEQSGGEKVYVKTLWDSIEEARWIAEEIESLQRKGQSLSTMAILVRAGYQTREFEECFLKMGIPYQVVGGFRFYERQEIRDAVAYLRLATHPHDGLAFERIINVPKRGIGPSTLNQIHLLSREKNIALFDAALQLVETDEVKGKAKTTLVAFLNNIKRWHEIKEAESASDYLKLILEESGYFDMWKTDKSPEAPGRLENLRELVSAVAEFESVDIFLEHISLVMENANKSLGPMLTIMTMHSAKGLEFECVFLPGWEEGVFPSQKAVEAMDNLEEERRLGYVALTRAKKKAYISFATRRHIYGQWQSTPPSRFLNEIPRENVELLPASFQRLKPIQYQVPSFLTPFEEEGRFRKGERVFHIKFGYGTVKENNGGHVFVFFDHSGPKKVLENFLEKAGRV